jgi:transmembrane sensor
MADSAGELEELRWIQATRLVAGELEAEEAARCRAWLCATPDGAAILGEVEAAWREASPLAAMPPHAWDADAGMHRFREARARLARGGARGDGRLLGRWGAPAVALRAAAVLVALVGAGWWGWRATTSASALPDTMVVQAAPGTPPREALLPDGTRLTLAPGSTVRAARGFGPAHRALELDGEALVTVAPGAHPLRVRVRGVTVEDVSTAFVVRPDARGVVVAVVQGAVVVGARRDTVREGTGGIATDAGLVAPLPPGAFRSAVGWTRGALSFEDEPLADVVRRVSRWTGIALAVDAAIARQRVTVTFAGEAPRAMVEILATTTGARLDSTAGGWRLRPGTP